MSLFSTIVQSILQRVRADRAKEEARSEALLGPTDQNAAGSFAEPSEGGTPGQNPT